MTCCPVIRATEPPDCGVGVESEYDEKLEKSSIGLGAGDEVSCNSLGHNGLQGPEASFHIEVNFFPYRKIRLLTIP